MDDFRERRTPGYGEQQDRCEMVYALWCGHMDALIQDSTPDSTIPAWTNTTVHFMEGRNRFEEFSALYRTLDFADRLER